MLEEWGGHSLDRALGGWPGPGCRSREAPDWTRSWDPHLKSRGKLRSDVVDKKRKI